MNRWIQRARTAARLGIARTMAGKAMRECRRRTIILVYHRVAAAGDTWLHDEPGMAVRADAFLAQMDFVRRNFTPVPLKEIADAVARGLTPPAGAFAVTFDDAWADAANALPILRRSGIPATMFASTSNIGSEREFWTSRFLRILSSARNGRSLRLESWPRAAATAAKARVGSKRLDHSPALTWLAALPADAREHALNELAELCGVAADKASGELMTAEDLRAWLSAGMEVGSHGHDHSCLTNSDADVLRTEIVQSKRLLEEVLNREINGFAYPYGEANAAARDVVRQSGYRYACALERPRREAPDVFMLPRRAIHQGAATDLKGHFSAELFVCYLAGVFDRRQR